MLPRARLARPGGVAQCCAGSENPRRLGFENTTSNGDPKRQPSSGTHSEGPTGCPLHPSLSNHQHQARLGARCTHRCPTISIKQNYMFSPIVVPLPPPNMETTLRSWAVRELRNLAEVHNISLVGAVVNEMRFLSIDEIEQFLSCGGQEATSSPASSMAAESAGSTTILAVPQQESTDKLTAGRLQATFFEAKTCPCRRGNRYIFSTRDSKKNKTQVLEFDVVVETGFFWLTWFFWFPRPAKGGSNLDPCVGHFLSCFNHAGRLQGGRFGPHIAISGALTWHQKRGPRGTLLAVRMLRWQKTIPRQLRQSETPNPMPELVLDA